MIHVFTNGEHLTVSIPHANDLERLVAEATTIRAVHRFGHEIDGTGPTIPVQIGDSDLLATIIPLQLFSTDLAVLTAEVAHAATNIVDDMSDETVFYLFAAKRGNDGTWNFPEKSKIVQLITDTSTNVEEFHQLPESEKLELLGY